MGQLVCGGIAPHGSLIIGEIAGEKLELFKPTRDAMERLGKVIMENKPDSLWQMLILYGALKVRPMVGELLSYQVFGMEVASYRPEK